MPSPQVFALVFKCGIAIYRSIVGQSYNGQGWEEPCKIR